MPLKKIFTVFFVLFCSVIHGQADSTGFIKLDAAVKKAVLPNGLTYYIRNNKYPAERVELRLVVKAGSVDEDDNQRGMAHFLEHMAFNGTKNFKKNELIKYMQDIGLGFGSDINAFTFFNYTIYELSVPTSKPEYLEKAFRVLSDWAYNITLLDEDIDDEREIILEEERLRKGAVTRLGQKVEPFAYKDSRYAERRVIGTEAGIRSFKSDDLRKFYKEWYRPDLMALIAVGDITDDMVEPYINRYFAPLTNPVTKREKAVDSIPPYRQNIAKVYTDNELSDYSVNILYSLMRSGFPLKKEEFKSSFIQKLILELLNIRLHEQTMYGVAFSNAGLQIDYDDIINYSRYTASLSIPNAQMVIPAMTLYAEEIKRIKKFGFKEGELARIKSVMNAMNSKAYNERDKIDSKIYIQFLLDNFLAGKTMASLEWLHDMTKEFLATITLADLNKEAEDFLPDDMNYFVYLAGPGAKDLPTESQMLSALNTKNKKVEDIKEDKKIARQKLLKNEPVPGTIVEERNLDTLGVKSWKLGNGAVVLLKKTDFQSDEILFGASRLGGTSNFNPQDRYNYEYGLKLIDIMGYGGHSAIDLEKMLSGKLAFVSPYWDDATEGFVGYAAKNDVETLLELINLKATAPNANIMTFISSINRSKLETQNAPTDPESVFLEEVFDKFYGGNIRRPVVINKPYYFDNMDLLRIMNMYRERLSDINGMQFVFVGNIDEEVLLPLIKKYIASLPTSTENKTIGKNWLQPVKGTYAIDVDKGKENKSIILSIFSDKVEYDENLKLNMEVVTEILNMRLQENLREKMQGTYSAETSLRFEKFPYSNYTFIITIPTGPEKVNLLTAALNEDIEALVKNGPDEADLNKLKLKLIEENRLGMKQNGIWLNYLVFTRLTGENSNYFLKKEDYINALTPTSVQRAASIIFSSGNNFTGILRPEKK